MKRMDDPQARRFDVEVINHLQRCDEAGLIDSAEKAFEETVERTVEEYLSQRKNKSMILVSGPSGSGKTTSSYRFTDALKKHGLDPVVISLDNFFLPTGEMRRNPDGTARYDSVHSVNLSLVNRTLWALKYHREAEIPRFNFITGASESSAVLRIEPDTVVLMEGIHALNPLITYGLDYDSFFKICMNVDSAFYVDDEPLLSSRDLRFVRRAVRDQKHRGAPLETTYKMWPGVCEGEDLYIRPFYPYADIMLNTAYSYEPLVFKTRILPMLAEITGHPEYETAAKELYRKMLRFGEIDVKKVPAMSLLQEFLR